MPYKIVKVMGGLGNQMFQYAFAKSLEYHLQIPILLDKETWYSKPTYSNQFALNLFNIDLSYASKEQIAYATAFNRKPKIVRSILKKLNFPTRIANSEAFACAYIAEYLKPNSFIYFSGYFQNPRYFEDISSHIKEILSPPPLKVK